MKAAVGDRIVLASSQVDAAVRDGRVVEVRGADGAPPYVVEWSDTGRKALIFPGPDARIEHFGAEDEQPVPLGHVTTWNVRIDIYENGSETSAHATLVGEAPVPLTGHGRVRGSLDGTGVPENDEEIAAARALQRLVDRLQAVAVG